MKRFESGSEVRSWLCPKSEGVSGSPRRHWQLDEVFIRINGQQHYLWRAVDQDGDVIDILVQPRRDQRAAERFFRRLLRGQGKEPFRIVTDKLRSVLLACSRLCISDRDNGSCPLVLHIMHGSDNRPTVRPNW
jgi:transposase-like protein